MKTAIQSLLAALVLALPLTSNAGVFVSVSFAPPPLLVYEQPVTPGPDYIWVPGYWAWDPEWEDYYWVPGTWELAPQPYYYWTPGYWAWVDTVYVWHPGYWGPHVGYYGGINYGYGYGGYGYEGGRWEHDHFYYNTAVNHVDVTRIHNTYNTTVVNNYNVTRVSYNGGDGGVRAQPRPEEERAARERHVDPTPEHERHIQMARQERAQHASHREGGDQVIAATPKPAALTERQVVRAPKPQWNRERAEQREQRESNRPEERASGPRGNTPDESATTTRENARDSGRNRDRNPDAGGLSADLDKPLQNERPQSRRHRDRSSPVTTPESRPVPESAPRDVTPSEPVEKNPHFEHMRPIPRDDEPAREPIERPRRPERMQGFDRPERSIDRPERSFDRPERNVERSERNIERSQRGIDRPDRNIDRPQPSFDRPERAARMERPQMDSRPPPREAMPRGEAIQRPQVERPQAERRQMPGPDKPDRRDEGHGHFRG